MARELKSSLDERSKSPVWVGRMRLQGLHWCHIGSSQKGLHLTQGIQAAVYNYCGILRMQGVNRIHNNHREVHQTHNCFQEMHWGARAQDMFQDNPLASVQLHGDFEIC